MKIQPIIDKLFENWPVKVFCVVIALLLYFFFNVSRLDSKAFPIELGVVSDGQMMPVSSYQKHVRVVVRANAEDIASVTAKDISAVVNLEQYTKSGDYDIPVVLNLSKEILLIDPLEVRVIPDVIHMRIEDKILEYKDVQISFAEEIPHGYEIVSYSVNPSSLRVTGSRSAVEQTTKLFTDKIPLADRTESFSSQVSIATVNSLISVENNAKVVVSVTIQPIMTTAEYKDKAVSFVYLNPDLKIASGGDPVSFSVSGDLLHVEKLTENSFVVQADCSSIKSPGEYEISLNYILPENVTLLQNSAESVKITVVSASSHADSEN
ncbi:CdaR family protein [Treponema parvum]|uniref:CdaR family protein n=1 Tax=Treponema parvum TaxID=138851 RepID=UPI001AEBC52F|nr:CdaR family protein [Treponema parvum]QTQ16368.1 hypothetical protein HXT04_06510 [Treponema parvum]